MKFEILLEFQSLALLEDKGLYFKVYQSVYVYLYTWCASSKVKSSIIPKVVVTQTQG